MQQFELYFLELNGLTQPLFGLILKDLITFFVGTKDTIRIDDSN